jgi:hypothetical protein
MKDFDNYNHHKSLPILTFVLVILMLSSSIEGGIATATTDVKQPKKFLPIG